MTLVGFPDFQEQAQWQSPVAVLYSAGIANGATKAFPETGPVYFNVSNWQATQLRISGAQALDVELIWYDAIPAGAYLGRTYYTTVPNIGSVVSFPNAGPYLQVNVSNLSGFADTLVAVVAFTNRRQQPFIVASSSPMVASGLNLVAAGATRVASAVYSYAGPAMAWIRHDSNQAWTAYCYGKTSDGTQRTFATFGNLNAASGNVMQAVTVPPQSVVMELTNSGAAGHNFDFGIMPDVFR